MMRGIGPVGTPILSPVMRMPVRFAADNPADKPPTTDPVTTTPAQQPVPEAKPGFWGKTRKVARSVGRKFTSWTRFKHAVSHGYQESKADLLRVLHSKDPGKIAGRMGLELLGLTLIIVLLPVPMPFPNPGYFISPTGRKFLVAFVKDDETQPLGKKPEPPKKPD